MFLVGCLVVCSRGRLRGCGMVGSGGRGLSVLGPGFVLGCVGRVLVVLVLVVLVCFVGFRSTRCVGIVLVFGGW